MAKKLGKAGGVDAAMEEKKAPASPPVPKNMAAPEEVRALPRAAVRYAMFRLRTQAEGGAKAPVTFEHGTKDRPGVDHITVFVEPLRLYFEAMPGFLGWPLFGDKWDIAPEGDHHRGVLRPRSVHQEWNDEMEMLAIPFPGLNDPIN